MARWIAIALLLTNAACSEQVVVREVEAACGNGNLEANEACDDGNRVDSDACLNSCSLRHPGC